VGNNEHFHKVEDVYNLMLHVAPEIDKIMVSEEEIPYGRYIVHEDPQGRFNIQIHAYTMDYEGKIHDHRTWGIMWILRGGLFFRDYVRHNEETTLMGGKYLSLKSSHCFCPPASDWHQSKSPKEGLQPVSLHVYGKDYDLDVGGVLDDALAPVRQNRGTPRDLSILKVLGEDFQ